MSVQNIFNLRQTMAGVDAPYFGAPPLSEDKLQSKGIHLIFIHDLIVQSSFLQHC